MLAHTLSWACEHYGGHRMQTTLDFKLLLETFEIYLFTYPTLTKRPAEITLLGCEWQQVKTLSYMTWEHIGNIKLIKNNIKSDINNLNMIKTGYFSITKLLKNKYYQF